MCYSVRTRIHSDEGKWTHHLTLIHHMSVHEPAPETTLPQHEGKHLLTDTGTIWKSFVLFRSDGDISVYICEHWIEIDTKVGAAKLSITKMEKLPSIPVFKAFHQEERHTQMPIISLCCLSFVYFFFIKVYNMSRKIKTCSPQITVIEKCKGQNCNLERPPLLHPHASILMKGPRVLFVSARAASQWKKHAFS